MKYLIIAILILLGVAVISIRLNIKQNKTNKQLKQELEKEAQIEKQKDKIHSGNDTTNFDNSLNILSEYSEKRS
jgi:uncharacterized membrane-anchored protein YhcB (DUF1043 family)